MNCEHFQQLNFLYSNFFHNETVFDCVFFMCSGCPPATLSLSGNDLRAAKILFMLSLRTKNICKLIIFYGLLYRKNLACVTQYYWVNSIGLVYCLLYFTVDFLFSLSWLNSFLLSFVAQLGFSIESQWVYFIWLAFNECHAPALPVCSKIYAMPFRFHYPKNFQNSFVLLLLGHCVNNFYTFLIGPNVSF